jgi:hypothetical protein
MVPEAWLLQGNPIVNTEGGLSRYGSLVHYCRRFISRAREGWKSGLGGELANRTIGCLTPRRRTK